MKKYIALIVIISFIYSFTIPCLAQALTEQNEVVEIINNYISGNIGAEDGVSKGDIFYIKRMINKNLILIGKVQAVHVKNKISAFKILEVCENKTIQKGDFLVNEPYKTVIEEAQNSKFEKSKLSDKRDYYELGKDKASREYGGTGHFIMGMVIGFLTGLIGYGIGFAIVSSRGVNIPKRYLESLNKEQRSEFREGFERKVKSKRRISFSLGATIGIVAIVLVIANANK